MATFCLTVEQVSPLQIQFSTLTGAGEIRGWSAWCEGSVGSASLPHFYRPSIPAKGRLSVEASRVVCLTQPGRQSAWNVISAFSTNPSYPDVIPVRTNPPYRINVSFPRGKGIVLLPSSYGILYSKTDFIGQPRTKDTQDGDPVKGGFLWDCEVKWEEY